MTTVSKASTTSSSTSSRYVPIRPLFRPLLPKPDATKKATALPSSSAPPSLACLKSTAGTTTTTTTTITNTTATSISHVKIERRRSDGDKNTRPKKVTKAPCKPKKPRAQSQPAAQAAVAVAAVTLPSTISPASLVCSNNNSTKTKVSKKASSSKKSVKKQNPASIDTLINNASPDNPAPIAGMSSINTASLLNSTAKNALRPSKLSSKLMLCSDASSTTGLATPSFDLGSSELYLLGSSAPTSPSSLVDSISLWDDETKQDLSIQLELATSGELDASSPLAGSPIEPLTLQMDIVGDEHAVDDDFSTYGESLTLDSYLTPESDDAAQEFRDTLFLGTVNS